ncbi:MAG TPA: hypothetical protein VFK81_22740 [Terriglobales bacterium]|jgi:hypothetical protein|nr:hypothetical protein [Terriglobales bacterium]
MRFLQVLLAASACFVLHSSAWPEPNSNTAALKPGSLIEIQIDHDVRMHKGTAVAAHTVYPVYIDNRLLLPKDTEVQGKIVQLRRAPRKVHFQALEHADFTPPHQATLQFTSFQLPDGSSLPFQAATSAGGIRVVRFDTTPAGLHPPSLPRRMLSDAMAREKATVSSFAGLRRWDRAKRFIFSQLPLHPEYVDQGLQYTLSLSHPLIVPFAEAPPVPLTKPASKTGDRLKHPAIVSAKLLTTLTSRNSVPGTKVTAIVTQPLLNDKNQVEVPQNTLLLGEVTQAKPAGKWGKDGTLRFAFHQMQFPAGYRQPVHGTTQAVMADQRQNLGIDAEGGAQPQPKSALAPIALSMLAAHAAEDDEAVAGAAASNGFALLGRFVAMAPGARYFGAGVGAFAAGRAIYERFIDHGTDVSFPTNTRIEIAVDPIRSPLMHLSDNKK